MEKIEGFKSECFVGFIPCPVCDQHDCAGEKNYELFCLRTGKKIDFIGLLKSGEKHGLKKTWLGNYRFPKGWENGFTHVEEGGLNMTGDPYFE